MFQEHEKTKVCIENIKEPKLLYLIGTKRLIIAKQKNTGLKIKQKKMMEMRQ